MDDIGNLVYVLVFIVWFLYRTFGKSGKKPVKPIPPVSQRAPSENLPKERRFSESTPPPVTFEDILRELTGAPPVNREQQPEVIEEIPHRLPPDHYPDFQPESSFEVLEPEAVELEPVSEVTVTPVKDLRSKFKQSIMKPGQSSVAARKAFKMIRSKQGAKQAFILKQIFDRKY